MPTATLGAEEICAHSARQGAAARRCLRPLRRRRLRRLPRAARCRARAALGARRAPREVARAPAYLTHRRASLLPGCQRGCLRLSAGHVEALRRRRRRLARAAHHRRSASPRRRRRRRRRKAKGAIGDAADGGGATGGAGEYSAPARLLALCEAAPRAVGSIPVGPLYSTDTVGGNSGSPVLAPTAASSRSTLTASVRSDERVQVESARTRARSASTRGTCCGLSARTTAPRTWWRSRAPRRV